MLESVQADIQFKKERETMIKTRFTLQEAALICKMPFDVIEKAYKTRSLEGFWDSLESEHIISREKLIEFMIKIEVPLERIGE